MKQCFYLPEKEFKIVVIKILTKLGRKMDKYSENVNEEFENIKKSTIEVTELKKTIVELKSTLVGFDSRLDETEESVNQLKDEAVSGVQQQTR